MEGGEVMEQKLKLNLGSGRRNIGNDWVNVDKYQHPNVKVVYDLNFMPYPFKDESVDQIYMNHVLEHLENPYEVMLECYRILKFGGTIEIIVPHRDSLNSSDISHRCYFTERSMSHLCNQHHSDEDIHESDEISGSSLQCKSNFFKILELNVKRIIELPHGLQYKGFNLYHNRIGIGRKSEIHWKMVKI